MLPSRGTRQREKLCNVAVTGSATWINQRPKSPAPWQSPGEVEVVGEVRGTEAVELHQRLTRRMARTRHAEWHAQGTQNSGTHKARRIAARRISAIFQYTEAVELHQSLARTRGHAWHAPGDMPA